QKHKSILKRPITTYNRFGKRNAIKQDIKTFNNASIKRVNPNIPKSFQKSFHKKTSNFNTTFNTKHSHNSSQKFNINKPKVQRPNNQIQCYNCKGYGHFSTECSSKKQENTHNVNKYKQNKTYNSPSKAKSNKPTKPPIQSKQNIHLLSKFYLKLEKSKKNIDPLCKNCLYFHQLYPCIQEIQDNIKFYEIETDSDSCNMLTKCNIKLLQLLTINSVEKFDYNTKSNTPRANLYCLELGPIEVVYDTGSDINAINRYIWSQYPSLQKRYKKKRVIHGANNQVNLKDYFELTIIDEKDIEYKEIFYVIDNLQERDRKSTR